MSGDQIFGFICLGFTLIVWFLLFVNVRKMARQLNENLVVWTIVGATAPLLALIILALISKSRERQYGSKIP